MKIAKKLFILGTAVLMSLTFATGAYADDSKTQDLDVTINGGDLSLSVPNIKQMDNIVLSENTEVKFTGFDGGVEIKDLTGTQAGWRLEASATPLASSDYQLGTCSMSLIKPEAIEIVNGLGVTPYPDILVNTVCLDNGSVTVANAEEGEGMGHYRINFTDDRALSVEVDASSAKTGTYESTISWNLTTAP